MSYDFLTGGARSGKSRSAERLAGRAASEVTVVATAEPGDDEMARRIERHRAERPSSWDTVEEPRDLLSAISAIDPGRFVVLDCLTLWLANILAGDDVDILETAEVVAAELARRPGGGVVVSNEVGDGIVPADPLSRRYRDLLGSMNRIFADRADRAFLVVAGQVIRLERPPW